MEVVTIISVRMEETGGAGIYVLNGQFRNDGGSIQGGNGGRGGDAKLGIAGKGGNGGWGVVLTDGSALINSGGWIIGGMGGTAGDSEPGYLLPPGDWGKGGGGVYMQNGSYLENSKGGNIQGGRDSGHEESGGYAIYAKGDGNRIVNNGYVMSGSIDPNDYAILIKGNQNKLEIKDFSEIKGKVRAEGQGNILEFNIMGDYLQAVSGQFEGFNSFAKTGTGDLFLEGETDAITPWTISEGTLVIEDDGSLGNNQSTLTLSGGTLAINSEDYFGTARTIRLEAADSPNTIQVVSKQNTGAVIVSPITGPGGLTKTGPGNLTLTADNSYEGGTIIKEGQLMIGDMGNSGSVKGPIEIERNASLAILRSDTFLFDNQISGEGYVFFNGGGYAIFNADSSGFNGRLNIVNGKLTVGGFLGGLVDIMTNGILIGPGTVNDVNNGGTINLDFISTYSPLTIRGNYYGQPGSKIEIGSVLGDDMSKTDHLVINGNTEGQSNVFVRNVDGKGGDTQKGIEVISVGGRSDAVFTLVNKDKTGWGEPAVIAGAHAYTLQKGSASDPSDGNWYLRTTFNRTVCPSPEPGQPAQPCTPSCPSPEPGQPAQPCTPTCSLTEPEACSPTGEIYQPGVPLYTGYGQFVSSLNTVSSMEQRIGNRYWSGASARQIMQGDGPGMDEIPDPNSPQILTDAGLIWGRINAAHSRMQLYNSTINTSYDSDQWNIRAGIDHQLKEYTTSRLIGSVWLEYGSAKADLSSYFGSGDIDVNSYSLGTAITWFHENGFYLDGQGRFSWTRSDITSSTLNRTLVSGAKGDGFAFGLEAGRRLALNAVWSWTPQAQIIWSQTRLDDFSDPYEAEVSFDAFKNLTARAGVTVQYANTWQDRNGYTTRGQVYALANLYRELLGQSPSVIISEEKLKPGNADRNWGEVGLGGTYAFHNDKYALYGETALAGGLDDIKNNYTLRGNVGLRVHW